VVRKPGRRLRAELREIDDDRPDALGGQPLGGADHQARLAHLPRRQDVAEIAGPAVLEKLVVGVPLEVHTPAGLHGPASDKGKRLSSSHAGAR
jgi:hypothetical protein